METPNQQKERLWQEFQEKSGLAKPSRGFKAVILLIAVIIGTSVAASIFQ